ncbi:hypothetical protein ACQ143_07560 [Microbacterium sp. MC2]
MEWTAGVDAGDWIRERVDDPWRGTIHDVVPRGFAAYARVPHRSETPELPEGPSAELVAMIAGILTAHTTTPDDGFVGLWEGTGGLLGHFGEAGSRAFFQFGDPGDGALAHHNAMLGHAVKDRFNNPYRKQTWQEGILSREISEGPRLELPGRGHVLFRGGVRELASSDWVLHVPWRDRIAEEHGFEPSAAAPSIVWPADRAWVMVSEVDLDCTLVGGEAALIAALVADTRFDAQPVPADAALTADDDR